MLTEFEKEREEWRQIGFRLGFIDGFIRGAQEFPLSLDLLDFEKPSDLTEWLRRHNPRRRL
jgi:hypothetical protein